MNLKKIKKILKSKKGIVASGVIVGTIVIGIIGGILVNGASKSNDIAENNKPVINNKKDKDELVVSKENNNAEDKKEEVKETEPNINMPENSTSSNEIKNNNNDTNKNNSQSSSSNANSNTSNNNSSNTSNNNSSNTSSNTSSITSSNTSNGSTHTHSWNPITEQVHHDEEGHWEDVVVKPAWTESIPVYEDQARDICNTCNADLTGTDIVAHVKKHMMAGEDKGGHRTEWVQVQVGTNSVNHPAVTEKKWVVDKAAWTETVTVGHSCSCGATK